MKRRMAMLMAAMAAVAICLPTAAVGQRAAQHDPADVLLFDQDAAAPDSGPARVDEIAGMGRVTRVRYVRVDANTLVRQMLADSSALAPDPARLTRSVVSGVDATVELFDGVRLDLHVVEAATNVGYTSPRSADGTKVFPMVEWHGLATDTDGGALAQVPIAFIPDEFGHWEVAATIVDADATAIEVRRVEDDVYVLVELEPSLDAPPFDPPTDAQTNDGAREALGRASEVVAASHGGEHLIEVLVAYGNGNPGDIVSRISQERVKFSV